MILADADCNRVETESPDTTGGLETNRRLKLFIEYEGSNFSGWQFQPGIRTVQGEIESALLKIIGSRVKVCGSGRTDAGVHATGQVAHIDLEGDSLTCEQLRRAINSNTGRDVWIRGISETEPGFHARFSAVSRTYVYSLIHQPFPMELTRAWCPDCRWDDNLIREALTFIDSAKSFRAFCRQRPGETDYICKVRETSWISTEKGAEFAITADRFFHQMVRGIVGALLDVGRGYYSMSDFITLVSSPSGNAKVNFAPPHGLALVNVEY